MGYYTSFELETLPPSQEAINQLRAENSEAAYCLEDDGGLCEPGTWYSYRGDLEAFSVRWPEVVFRLHGRGEDPIDLWTLYVKNGKSQLCPAKITYDEYDESKLR